SIMTDCQLSWTELFRQYVGKNVLNVFRQDNGYKDGTYRKLWGGREDNEVLVDIIHLLDANQPDFKHAIYSSLQVEYKKSEG
ncbi:MAG: dUTP diphosphatase, partial [Pseudomonadota bacterium]|nr:dUTP diphosphatase [Pseudomonadota bacterium]